jgi:uncharacterized protein (DUF2062 family)
MKKAWRLFREQLVQGSDPRGIALTCSTAAMLAIFPMLGVTTALCVLVGVRFKLNQPLMQAVNYLLYPAQILLFPLFIKGGSSLFGSPVSIDPGQAVRDFSSNPTLFMRRFGVAGLEGVVLWLLVAPLLGFVLFRVLNFGLRKIRRR